MVERMPGDIEKKTPRQQLIEDRDKMLMSIAEDFQGLCTMGFSTGEFSFLKKYWEDMQKEIERIEREYKAHWNDPK